MPPQVGLVYSGSATDATVDATTASPLASNVIGSSGAAVGGSLLAGVSAQGDSAAASAPQPTGATGLSRRLGQAIRGDALARAGSGSALAGATLSQTIPCDSGSINISGTVSDSNGTGTVSIDYVDCRTGSDTINGPGSLRIDAFDQTNRIITDGTLTFTRVRFTGPGFNSDLTGTLRTQVSGAAAPWCSSGPDCGTETLTQNITVQDNTTMRMTQSQNLSVVNAFENIKAPTFFTQSITGRVCHDQRGCVNVTTSTAPFTAPWGPLYFATRAQSFPDWGIINLAGAAGGTVTITSLGADLAKIQVGANTARLRWAEFGTALGADLADSDGDGMHNSWETAMGLNPAVNDAAGDADGDGYTNLAEYRAGSSAATNGSVPEAVRHIWVTGVRDLAADPGGMINVFVDATGSGVFLDPATAELDGPFSGVAEPNRGTARTVTDAQGRTFTLAQTANPTTWTLSSSTGTSITISNVAGTDAGSLIRYGTRGLAFRTIGSASPGYIYLVESRTLIP